MCCFQIIFLIILVYYLIGVMFLIRINYLNVKERYLCLDLNDSFIVSTYWSIILFEHLRSIFKGDKK
jgi:hypothetical protein